MPKRGNKKQAKAKSQPTTKRAIKRRWRAYETSAGNRPVDKFLKGLSDDDLASVAAAMQEVRDEGLSAARHLSDDIYEVRADGDKAIYRILFAPQGSKQQVLLSLEGFQKKTQKTPPETIKLAKRRLRDWERRGEELKAKKAKS